MFRTIINYIRWEINNYSSASRTFIFFSALIFFLTRITGDSLLVVFNRYGSGSMIIWKSVTAFSVIAAITSFLFNDLWKKDKTKPGISQNDFSRNIFSNITYTVVLLLLASFLPGQLGTNVMSNNIFILLHADLTAFVALLAGISVYYTIYKWLLFKKHKKTKLYLSILTIALVTASSMKYLLYLFNLPFSTFFNDLIEYSGIIIGIYFFFIIKRTSWIAILPRKEKYNILVLSFVAIIISALAASLALDTDDGLGRALFLFIAGSQRLVGLTFILSSIFYFRVFLTVLISLPTADIVERRIFESKSLMHLNRIVAQATDFNNLVNTVTRLVLNASGAVAAWTELRESGRVYEFSLSSSPKISQETLVQLHDDDFFKGFVDYSQAPVLIESVRDFDSEIIKSRDIKACVNSIIVIPLFTGGERIGNLVAIHTDDYGFEDGEVRVLEAFSDNINIALENARLLKDSIEKEKLKSELNLARDIQRKLLPARLPEARNYSISAFTVSAEEVGGDYYDMVFLQNGKPCLLIGDVSGKGMSAAFYMAQLKGVVLSVARESTGAADLLMKINETLYGTMEKQMYITLSALVIENDRGLISFSRAGHMPSLIKNDHGVKFVIPNGLGIGLCDRMMFNSILQEETIQLGKNGRCVMYTDGVSELRNTSYDELGTDFLKQILNSTVYTNASMIVDKILEIIAEHSKDTVPHDDMTIFALVYEGEETEELKTIKY